MGCLGWLLMFSCKSKVETTQPKEEPIIEAVYASGYVKSKSQYQVFPKSSGTIKKLLVGKGDVVAKGQVIANIQSEVTQLNVENAELTSAFSEYSANQNKVQEAKVNLQLAAKKMQSDSLVYVRQKRLWSEQIGTRYELEQRELQFQSAKSAYEGAYWRFKELERQLKFNAAQSKKTERISKSFLSDVDIRSDRNGKIYSLLEEEGEMVGPQAPIAIIGDANEFILLLQVDENDITRIQVGQEIQVTLESYPEKVFEAEVEKVYPLMNERTRSFEIEARFISTPAALFPNLTVEANIILTRKNKALTIPRKFISNDNEVWISSKEKRKVKTGLKDYNRVEILEGLTATETIYLPK